MSESVTERLSQFTPHPGSLDRDALLFAAGRASARPNRRWLALAGTLAVSQLVTLLLLWPLPRPVESPLASPKTPGFVEPQPAAPMHPTTVAALRERALATEGNLPTTAPSDNLVAPEPPLHAFAASLSAWTD